MTKTQILLCIFLFLGKLSFSQTNLTGIVLNENKEALAFVNILINGDYSNGVTTDIDGKFEIQSQEKINELILTYVGYEKLIYVIQESEIVSPIKITLKSAAAVLPEAIIIAGENPAHRIIRKAVENRHINNPEKMDAFQCQTYNKLIVEWMPNEEDFKKYIEEKRDTSKSNLIQTRIEKFNKLVDGSQKQHLFMMESVSDRKYLHPEKNSEVVLYNRASGLKHPSFVALANDVQPFSFYQTYLEILDKSFLNPISPGSTKKYFFTIEDTLYQQADTVYIISFQPKKGKNFEGLKGVLYINTNGYALQNVIASPNDPSFIKMKIEQRYVLVKEEEEMQWFPEQLNFVIEATKYPHKLIGTRVTGKSYISKVQLNPEINKKDFKTSGYTTAKNANIRTDSIWQNYRSQVLTEKEARTYEFMDSLGAKKHFDTWLNMMEALASGRMPIGKVDLLLTKILNFNDYENVRLGIGLATNDRFSRHVELGGHFGYGFDDEAWKYAGYLMFNILPEKRLQLRFDYQKDIREPGLTNISANNSVFTRRIYANRFDTWKNSQVSLSGKLAPFVRFKLHFSKNQWNPNYDYALLGSDVFQDVFDFAEAGLDLSFTFREKTVRFLGTETSETKYPLIFLSYRKGFSGLLDGNFDYHKLTASIEDDFRIRNLGTTSFRIEGGITEGLLPYSHLFSASGIGRGFKWVEIDNTFQTMDLYEFLSDRFVHLFFEHNFETHLLKLKNWKPEFAIVQNIGFGTLDKLMIHEGIEFKTMEKVFFETGFYVDNLYRVNYFNLLYLGIGAGVYYRYGDYAFSKESENLAYRFRLSFSF